MTGDGLTTISVAISRLWAMVRTGTRTRVTRTRQTRMPQTRVLLTLARTADL